MFKVYKYIFLLLLAFFFHNSFGQYKEKDLYKDLFQKKQSIIQGSFKNRYTSYSNKGHPNIISEFQVSEKAGGPEQTFPWIVRRGDSGYIMIWWDERNGRAIWGQLFDAEGNKTGNNFVVADELVNHIITDETKLRVASNDSGEFVVAWSAGIPNYSIPNIVACKFNSDATPYTEPFLVTQDERPIVNIYPDIFVNSDGSFVCVWKKTDLTFGPNELWFKRFNADCTPKGNPVQITDDGEKPSITGSGNGEFSLLWSNNTSYPGDALLAGFDSSGTIVRGPDVVSQSTGRKIALEITRNETGTMMLGWLRDQSFLYPDLVIRLFDSNGIPITNEIIINDDLGTAGYYGQGPYFTWLNNEVWFCVWPDQRNDRFEIWGQLIADDGSKFGNNFIVSDNSDARASTIESIDSKGIVAWEDKRNSQKDIYFKNFSFSNELVLESSILINDDRDDALQFDPVIAIDESGRWVVSWTDLRKDNIQIYLQRLQETQQFIGTNHNIFEEDWLQICSSPTLTLCGSQIIVGYSEFCAFSCPSYAMSIDFAELTDTIFHIGGSCDIGAPPAQFVSLDNESFLASWSEYNQINARLFKNNGEELTDLIKVNTDSSNAYYGQVHVSGNSSGKIVIVWVDNHDENYSVYAQRLNSEGSQIGSNFKINVDSSINSWLGPRVSMDSEGNFGISWCHSMGDTTNVFIRFYDWNGTALTNPINVNQNVSLSTWVESDIAMNSTGQSVVVWDMFSGDTWKCLGQQFNENFEFVKENFPISSATGEINQTSPKVCMREERVFVTWADDRQAEFEGNYDIYAAVFDYDTVVSPTEPPLPEYFVLYQNYPNPFNSSTNIQYDVPSKTRIVVKIYNSLGKEICSLIDKIHDPGIHTISWNGTDHSNNSVSSGIYFCRMNAGNVKQVKKIVLMK